ncbi:UNVERIFIED_CONTAM: hypothetical protein GTU68_018060 [Idotea baltica]|nr:hypothetical protein [Idotea baltica]
MSVSLDQHLDSLKKILSGFGVEFAIANQELNVVIRDQRDIHMILSKLKKDCLFEQLTDITAVDYLTYDNRFEVIYQLMSMSNNVRLRVKCKLKDAQIILVDSVSNIWSSADWSEREVYDMFGIYFNNHPDLRRVLTDYGFVGHPLRKDFPQTGYVEMRYDESLGKVVYEPVEIDDRVNTARVVRGE